MDASNYAAEKGATAVARILLEHGADIEAQGRNGMRQLHCVAQFKSDNDDDEHVASVLLRAGANMDNQDSSQKYPLHWAALGCILRK
jgi:ankyrin repeat protein